MKDFACPS